MFSINIHIVFCIKYRRKVLNDIISERFKDIFIKIAPKYDIILTNWKHNKDQVRMLIRMTPKIELSKFINVYRELLVDFPSIKSMLWKEVFWSRSYLVISVGEALIEKNII